MKILNWFGSGFFRTLGRIVLYILLGFLVSLLLKDNASASTMEQNYFWINNSKTIVRGGVSSASDGSSYTMYHQTLGNYITNNANQQVTNFNINRSILVMSDTDYLGPSGMTIHYQPMQIIRKDYLYSITTYICADKSLVGADFNSYPQFSIDDSGIDTGNEYTELNRTIYYSLSTSASGIPVNIGSYCYAYVSYMVTKQDANIYGLRLRKTGGSIANQRLYLVGYDFVSMGYYNEAMKRDIQEALGTATNGLATKQDVQRVQQEVQGINDSINDDNLDNEEVDTVLGDLESGYNNPSTSGPLSGFLLLPLNWVQSLLAPSQSCQPINLPLPYVNRTLTLPCLSQFWSNMGLLGTLVQACWIAVVGTRIFNGLFLIVTEVKNPDPDKDMTLLKSWEL